MSTTPQDHLRGYVAAAYLVEEMLDESRADRPKRRSLKMAKSAAYREGYWHGLLAAHCMHALGEHPTQEKNAAQIAEVFAKREAEAKRARLLS